MMMSLKTIQALPLCPRCLAHELTNWLNEKFLDLTPEVNLKIREELKDIKVLEGECLVCKSSRVSEKSLVNIMKIFEEHSINPQLVEEFRKLFFYPIS